MVSGHVYEGQFEALAKNPDIIIATPGRLIEILKQTDFSLKRIQYLVFDEADQLFEHGFKEQIYEIVQLIGSNR